MGQQEQVYAFDWYGGPVYQAERVSRRREDALRRHASAAYLISVLVQEEPGAPTLLRQYFALDLCQAIARAAELQVRLPALESPAPIVGLRPATDDELNAFFRAIDRIEKEMPGPVTETGPAIRTCTQKGSGNEPNTERTWTRKRVGRRKTRVSEERSSQATRRWETES